MDQTKLKILNKCDLLVVAWEDPTCKEKNAFEDADNDGIDDNSVDERLKFLC